MHFNKNDIFVLYPKLLTYVKYLTKDHSKAEDIVQDAILKALENEDQLKNLRNLTAWLITICRNKFLDSVKKITETQLNEDNALHQSSDIKLESFEVNNIFDKCINKIKKNEKEALLLSFFRNMTSKDISEHLNKPHNTILTWIANSKNQFVLCVDGGVNTSISKLIDSECIVSGSSVLKHSDPIKQIMRLQTNNRFEN